MKSKATEARFAASNDAADPYIYTKRPPSLETFTINGAGNGTRTRECQLGKLMPYHLAMPANKRAALGSVGCSIPRHRIPDKNEAAARAR